MASVFGHLATRFTTSPENLATEALAYVLARSPSAKRALNGVPASLGIALPTSQVFRTQAASAGADSDVAIPDMAGLDAEGRAPFLIEVKFWAGLTNNQPAGYLRLLPDDGPGLLLFVVPRRRLHTLWADMSISSAQAGLALPAPNLIAQDMVHASVGQHHLAVIAWPSLLDRLEAEARASNEDAVLSDIAQLRGLCEQMDLTGFVPVSQQELTNLEVPRRVLSLADLVPEISDRVVGMGIGNVKGLRPTHYAHGTGRFIRIGAAGGWLGVDHRLWARFGLGPLWINFSPTEFGKATAVLKAVAQWTASNPPRAFEADGSAAISLRILPQRTRNQVVDHLIEQLVELHGLLSGIRGGDTDALPEPEPSASQ